MSFAGEYSDPNHPGCKRTIEVDGTSATISGTDTPDGEIWKVSGTVSGDTIVVDFSPKGGPKELTGKSVPEGIRWEDGNVWTLVGFEGEYSDPHHPGCQRTVNVSDGTSATVSGTDTPDGEIWTVNGSIDGSKIVVDFSPKGGPKELTGKRVTEGIQWEDGNIWPCKA